MESPHFSTVWKYGLHFMIQFPFPPFSPPSLTTLPTYSLCFLLQLQPGYKSPLKHRKASKMAGVSRAEPRHEAATARRVGLILPSLSFVLVAKRRHRPSRPLAGTSNSSSPSSLPHPSLACAVRTRSISGLQQSPLLTV